MPASPQAAEQLRTIVDRIESLNSEKSAVAKVITDVYKEADGNGYDTKVLRKVVSLRKKSKAAREEEQAVLDLYLNTLESAPTNAINPAS